MKTSSLPNQFSVLIPDGEATYALSVVRCLAEVKDIEIYILSKNKYAPIRFCRHIAKFIHLSYGDTEEEFLEAIINTINKTNAKVLLPVDISAIRLISQNRSSISDLIAVAPLPETGSFDISNDKWLLSQWVNLFGIHHPKTLLFSPGNDFEGILNSITFPIIVKPRNGRGGQGIAIFENQSEAISWFREFDHIGDYIIQSYINGYDIDCSILSKDGEIIAHTIQKSIKYSVDYPWPYGLEFKHNKEVFSIAREVVAKMKWSGVVHMDLRYDEVKKEVNLIEMNPRFWASVTASIFAGVNFPIYSCLKALGYPKPDFQLKDSIVLRTGPALKMTWKRIFSNKREYYFDHSFFEFILKDPMPTLIGETLEYYQHYKKR